MSKTSIKCAVILAILAFIFTPVQAAFVDDGDASVEFVILLDVSGSMNFTDPAAADMSRTSTEGARIFGFLSPTFSDTNISLVIYNEAVRTVLQSTNVRSDEGREEFSRTLDDINNNNIPGFNAWSSWTNIGDALQVAYEILADSDADRKGVLLFTDGVIEMSTPALAELSRQNSNDARDAFAAAGIPIHTIGLDSVDFGVDAEFLLDLSETTGGRSIVVTSTDGLPELFAQIFTDLFDEIPPPEPEPGEFDSDGQLQHHFHIYGQAVREANITIVSGTAGANIGISQLLTETGVDVLNDSERVIVDSSSMTINIKLIEPIGGDWVVHAFGPPGRTVSITEIILFDISLQTTLADERIYLDFSENLNFDAFLFNNERDLIITSTQIYEDAVSRTHVEVIDPRGVATLLLGSLNPSSTAFNFDLDVDIFNMAGTYTIRIFLSNDRMDIVSEPIEIVVANPVLVVESQAQALIGNEIPIAVNLRTSNVGENIVNLPPFLQDAHAAVRVYFNGNMLETISLSIEEMAGGIFTVDYLFEQVGQYEFVAVLEDRGVVVLSSEPHRVVTILPTITSTFPTDISRTVFGGRAETASYDLDEHFVVSDDRALSFRVERELATAEFSAAVVGSMLNLEFFDAGGDTLRIIVSDGNVDLYTHVVNVEVNSMIARWIIAVIVVGAVLVVGGIAAYVISRNMKIGHPFKLALSIQENDKDWYVEGKEAISIGTMTKFQKPPVQLIKIIEDDTLFPSKPDNEILPFIQNVTLVGKPFSKDFWVVDKNKNRTNKKWQTFSGKNTIYLESNDEDRLYKIEFSKIEKRLL
ncbi:MAG: VWA domain-containing protein [Turicibacter sp.]|nr:VWA domain-containing protein [Turicibacter sp.]